MDNMKTCYLYYIEKIVKTTRSFLICHLSSSMYRLRGLVLSSLRRTLYIVKSLTLDLK